MPTLHELVIPYIRPLGYVPPSTPERYDIQDAFTKEYPGKTPLQVYCESAVSGDTVLQTACLILGA